MKRIENNPVKTREIYEEGVEVAKANLQNLQKWLNL
ncbi:MAG: hypothetical protein ACOC2F_07705 [Bacteroidota bacterium]